MIEKDDLLKTLLESKETPRLNSQFELNMMKEIHHQASSLNLKKKYLYLMCFFFGVGLLFGLNLATLISDVTITILGQSFNVSIIWMTLPLVGILLFVFDKIYRSIFYINGKEGIFDI